MAKLKEDLIENFRNKKLEQQTVRKQEGIWIEEKKISTTIYELIADNLRREAKEELRGDRKRRDEIC